MQAGSLHHVGQASSRPFLVMKKSASVEALFKRTALGIKPGLEVVTDLLQALDNPQRKLAVIHVAGTNGKGSVCAMLESVLRASGYKTGLYTSPHLIDFSERFCINGIPVEEKRLEHYIARVEAAASSLDGRPATFFEISTAMAYQYFADEGVDIAIIETGMGGRWDATNVIIPLVSVITHIDIDHTHFLGDRIEQIAAEKAGIIKAGRPVVSAPQSEAVMEVLRKEGAAIICSSEAISVVRVDGASSSVGKNKKTSGKKLHPLGSAEHRVEPNGAGDCTEQKQSSVYASQKLKIETHSRNLPPIHLPLLGECQRENCAVAVAALEVLADMLDMEPAFKKGLEAVEWGARFQTLQTDPLVILDGAHNPSAGRALAKTLKEVYPRHQIGFIFGFLDDKESVEFLRAVKPLVYQAWTVSIDAPRGTTAEHSATQCNVAGIEARPETVSTAWNVACAWAAAEPKRLVVITGSLYLKQALQK